MRIQAPRVAILHRWPILDSHRRADPGIRGRAADRRCRRGRARDYLPVVVVDDGSTDDTAARAETAGATVLRQVPNAGKGAALRAGFRHALEAGVAAVVTLDADGQHDPDEIPAFLEAFARTSGGAHHRPARLRRDAARQAAVERRSVADAPRPRSAGPCPTTSPAIGSSVGPDAGDARQRRIGLRVRGRDDRAVHRARAAHRRRCRSARSTPGRPSHIRPWRHLHASSCGSRARRGGSPAAAGRPRWSSAASRDYASVVVRGVGVRRDRRAGTAR